MAETVWVLCESGAILPHDLPLPEGLSQRVKTGEAKIVAGPDGGDLVEPEPVEVPAVEPVVEPEPVEAVTEPEPVEPEPVVVVEPEKKVRVPRQRTAPAPPRRTDP